MQRGSQYADRLFLRSSLTVVGDHTTVPAFRIGANGQRQVLADILLDASGGPSLDFRMWEDTSQEAVVPLRLTPTTIFAKTLGLEEWRIVPTTDDMMFQRLDPGTGAYTTLYTLQGMGGTIEESSSLSLGDWRLRQSGQDLLFEYQQSPGEYETRMVVRNRT
jgi:hypothetical protein